MLKFIKAMLMLLMIKSGIAKRRQTRVAIEARAVQMEESVINRTAGLRKLANYQEAVHEEEKRTIAKELHDEMGASLTSLSLHLEAACALYPDDAQWGDRMQRMRILVGSMAALTRRIQADLRPAMLDLFGIKAAINEHLDAFSEKSGILCRRSLPDDDVFISNRLELTIYRMLQEALNNVRKHARATEVEVILDVDEDRVALTVRDNGIGIAPECINAPASYGLRALQERAIFLGGTASVQVNNPCGTSITIALPLATP
ncbi:MAG: sensor histidine kinase [Pseudomonadota bacterium]